ncbi:MAG: hypothetical protein L0Y44_09620 [Phycisphaerales bacterium]|nr:hypothetical protein [Phycisphaerales bacterium]MCI0676925.1 hypothetical protein [Phycisphaerales bacterium]
MTPQAHLSAHPPLAREEGFLHYVAREGRTFLRWTIVACLIAIVFCMVSPLWVIALVPAAVLVVAYVLLLLTNEVERRSDVAAHAVLESRETAVLDDIVDDEAEADQLAPRAAALVKRESKIAAAIIGSVLIVALVIAGLLVPGPVLAIGALVLFAYMLLVAAPLWLGWIEDDIEIETTRLDNEHEPAAVKGE